MSNTRTTPPDDAHTDPIIQRLLDWLKTQIANLFTQAADLDSRITVIEGYGLQKRTRGLQNVSTTAAATGTAANVAHGLGTTPNQIQLTAQNSSGAGLAAVAAGNVGATTFDINLRYGDGVARTATISVGWEAIA